jgi:hypothetical protein
MSPTEPRESGPRVTAEVSSEGGSYAEVSQPSLAYGAGVRTAPDRELRSLRPQRDQRVDAGRAPRGQVARGQAHHR